ncbi:hypothetical protein BXZ70DRAFT_1012879 [Cristinia sonorae]|uniref:DUF6534 domain-containing protein n=1 Tax=Cristinia sonorae TaxID=1940300 RepID=A0A8K0UEN2_9AGAR|nr:hypothetical protein BXZ70DRAFT_1012879 [Cristinia sonorae]
MSTPSPPPGLPVPGSPAVVFITVPELVAHLMTCILMGVLIVQAYLYYVAFPKDSWRAKSVVTLSVSLEVLQIALAFYDAIRVFGQGWGVLSELDTVGLLWLDVSLLTGMIATVSQLFYAFRIHTLSQRYLIPAVVAFLSLLQLGFSIWSAVEILHLKHLSLITHSIVLPVAIVWLSTIAACDITITSAIFYYLWSAKKLSMNGQTNSILTRLMRLTVETGFITSTFTIVALILTITKKDTLLYTCFLGPTSKLYSNTLLAVLNSRVRIVGGRDKEEDNTMSLMHTAYSGPPRFASASVFRSRQGEVVSGFMVETTTDTNDLSTTLDLPSTLGSKKHDDSL